MNHFINLSRFSSAPLRYLLIALHAPLLAVMLAIHTMGGLLTHSTNLVVTILNAGSTYLQNLFGHVVAGVEGVVNDVRAVVKGR